MGSWTLDKVKLSSATDATIQRLGFARPTPVQAAAIPLFLSHKDVVVEAVTGSGKTLAFLVPIVEILAQRALRKHEVGAVVISPTRELAVQTHEVLGELLRERPDIRSAMLIGGTDAAQDLRRLAADGCNVLVSTPGRLLDILERGSEAVHVRSLEVLVLDEADRLLSLGFERTINAIIERLPKQRRTGLFSATMSDALSELIRTGLRNPVRVTVKVENVDTRVEQKTPESLKSSYVLCEYENRLPWVLDLLREHGARKSIVYFGTCASVEYFGRVLPLLPRERIGGLPAVFALHGRMDPRKRSRIYGEFVAAERAILICTDLAARGLDFADVELVIQYEAPQDPTTFVHRCGRTARSGRSGEAVLLLSESEDAYVEFLSNRKVPLAELPPAEQKTSLFEELRRLNGSDRDLLDRSTRAFVAFIRFYQEHQAKFIFRLKDLAISQAARSFGLLRLPKMPELKGANVADFVPSTLDVAAIQYKDAQRNKQRQASFEAMKSAKRSGVKPQRKRISDALSFDGKRPAQAETSTANKLDMDELDEDWKEYKKLRKLD